MGLGNKFKNIFSLSEEEYFDDVDLSEEDVEEDERSSASRNGSFGFNRRNDEDKVVDIRSSSSASAARTNMVFNKLDRYEDVGAVADVINDKRIALLNLETCPNDVSVRIIDFLSGVAYANRADIKRVAGRAYVITPHNVPLTGDMLDGMDHSGY